MGRSPCCSKEGLNRGAWTAHEDKILRDYITAHGEGRWRNLPKRAGLRRCGKSCRLRWLNYLRPDIKRGNISPDEEELIIRLHKLLGNRWSLIAGRLPGRTDNEIKNYWNTNLSKRVTDHRHQYNVASSGRLSAKPKNNKSSKNNNPMTQSNPIPSPNYKLKESLSLSHVVHTKATKCSRVFINPRPPSSRQLLHKNRSETEAFLHVDAAAAVGNIPSSDETAGLLDAYDNNWSLWFGGGKDRPELSSTDLLADFNMGELCLSDLLNSEFSEMCDFSTYSNNNSIDGVLSPSSDQPLVFSDEILNDWTQSNAQDTNVATNLHSFSSFLESSEEWLAE